MTQDENEQAQKLEKRIELMKTTLAFIAVLSVVPLVAVVPGVTKIIQPFIGNKRRYRTPVYMEGVIGKMQKKGLILVRHEGGIEVARLTEKGERALLKYKIKESAKKKKKWDGKWRVVIFDIKEVKRGRRDQVRKSIVRFGFLKLQNSVWVYPYDCEELVALLKAECHLGQDLLYMIVEKIEGDTVLKKQFQLD